MTPEQEAAAVAVSGPHTAQITVRVYPGGSGLVYVHVGQQGPVQLTPAEQVRTLRYAIEQIERLAREDGTAGAVPAP